LGQSNVWDEPDMPMSKSGLNQVVARPEDHRFRPKPPAAFASTSPTNGSIFH